MRKMLAAFLLLLLVAAAGCATGPAPGQEPKPPAPPAAETGVTPGKSAPAFTLEGLAGPAVAVPAAGKVTVLNFWATWCPPCREELPELDKFARDNPAVAFYAVDLQEPAAKVRDFLKQNGYSFPVLLDSGGSAAQAYRINAIPTTVVIDKSGLKFRKTGPVTAAELAGVIRGL
jgi:thiol-disulfide isomerase/thioredoxin